MTNRSMYEIVFLKHEPARSCAWASDKYEYLPDRGWKWLQRLAIGVLRWLGCYSQIETTDYKTHMVRPNDFIQAICEQRRELMSLYRLEGERLLIGSEEYFDLMKQQDQRMYDSFSFTAQYSYAKQIMGMKVTVVPWMKGILVMPKLEK